MRFSLYLKIINSNVEFLSKINPGFLSKMVLFDIDPIVEFICCFPIIAAAPVTTVMAFILIWLQIYFSWYFALILAFYILTLLVLVGLLSLSVGVRKRYRSTTTAVHGLIGDYIKNIKFIKANSLGNLLLRNIWRVRGKEMKLLKKITFFDTAIDILLFSPSLATSLIIIAVQRFLAGSFDVIIMYTIISALVSLRKPVVAIAEGFERFTEFKKSYENYTILLNDIPDYPKLYIKKLPLKGQSADDPKRVTYQFPLHMDPLKMTTEVDDDFSVWFRGCTFIDKSKVMEKKVIRMMKERDPSDKLEVNNQSISKQLIP